MALVRILETTSCEGLCTPYLSERRWKHAAAWAYEWSFQYWQRHDALSPLRWVWGRSMWDLRLQTTSSFVQSWRKGHAMNVPLAITFLSFRRFSNLLDLSILHVDFERRLPGCNSSCSEHRCLISACKPSLFSDEASAQILTTIINTEHLFKSVCIQVF